MESQRQMEPDNSKMIEMQKQQILNKMKYLRDQTLKYRDEINKFEQGKKYLEEENMRLMQEQKERELLRANKQKQMNEPIAYRDTETKTFYTGRVQQKYSNSGQAFDERYSHSCCQCSCRSRPRHYTVPRLSDRHTQSRLSSKTKHL